MHAEAIRRADPQAVIIYAVDAIDADMSLPEGCERYVTCWSRNGNLLGMPALMGIMETLLDVSRRTGRIPVKIDSDIIATGITWLSPLVFGQCSMIGICPGQLFCASGGCYGITGETIAACLDYLHSGVYWDTPGIRVEDETVSMLAAMSSPPWSVMFLQHMGRNFVLSSIFKPQHFENPEPLRYVSAWIDCGDRKLLLNQADAQCDTVSLKARAMRLCVQLFNQMKEEQAESTSEPHESNSDMVATPGGKESFSDRGCSGVVFGTA